MTPIWREAARANLRAIISYIAERNPRAASDLNERIGECVERLGEHPFLYRAGRVPGTREAVAHPNYILVYRVAGDVVEILNVVHSRRQYPPADQA
jgi:toxin ParE1/3/4